MAICQLRNACPTGKTCVVKMALCWQLLVISSLMLTISAQDNDGLDGLRATIPGEPGRDYPIYSIQDLQRFGANRSNGRPAQGQQGGQQQQQNTGRSGRTANNGRSSSTSEIPGVPGVPGRDYPINSLQNLRKRFNNLQLAPADLITPDYPGIGSRGNKNRFNPGQGSGGSFSNNNNKAGQNTFRTRVQNSFSNEQDAAAADQLFSGNYCPGGTLDHCINFCPRDQYNECVSRCGTQC